MKSTKKGFTLVEVLIVVVIIAILASLIVPRMLMQTDKAKAAEALQMIGAIRRAAERLYDFRSTWSPTGAYVSIESSPFAGGTNAGDWSDLGLTGIEKSKDWGYEYQSDGASANIIVKSETDSYAMAYSSSSETWTCNTPFKYQDSADPSKGCTI